NEIIVLFALSIGVVFICHLIKVPKIVGFLITGVITGPHGLGWVSAVEEVEVLAEIGVILLLFSIGIEFSLKNLLRIRRSIFIGGLLQVVFTLLAGFAIARFLNYETGEAIFLGFLIALSSTAIVLQILQERGEIDTPYGQTTLAILIFQDLIVIPMMLLTAILAGGRAGTEGSLLILLGKATGIIILVGVAAKWIVPNLLYQIARTGSRELFIMSVIVICFSVAWITSSMGLSLALGAFLAGLIISESEYSHQTLSNILPFKDVFTSFFFVSVGMLLDIRFLMENPFSITVATVVIIAIKSILGGTTAGLLGFPVRTMVLVGIALGQIGEFSFLLAKSGIENGFLQGDKYQYFLAISILSMSITPFMISAGFHFARVVSLLPLPGRLKSGTLMEGIPMNSPLRDHLIIIGFGLNGRNVARAARSVGINYAVIEMNPETVRNERLKGEPIYYGDATHEMILKHVNITQARTVVLAINDPSATRSIVKGVRRLNPKAHIIVRTRYLNELKALYELGANEVIPEEFETSVEIFTRVLKGYTVPKDEIERLIAEIRSDGYEMLRRPAIEPTALCDLKEFVHDIEISSFRVSHGSPIVGKSLAELALRKTHDVSVIAIRRGQELFINPDPQMGIEANDILIIIGKSERIGEVTPLFYGQ
ncbi:MAG: monovalent cation:proton antiporter-2 (CPA2) family protein, partial [Candidatus Bathyarchaeia archaeon]